MNNPADPNDAYSEQEQDGQDQYDESYADEGHDPSQLPVQDSRSFMQKFSGPIIFGGGGIFILVMGYITFAPMLFPKKSEIPTVPTSMALLNPQSSATPAQPAATPSPESTVIPAVPAAATTPDTATAPTAATNAMGVSPAAPVTNAPIAMNAAPSPAPVPTTVPPVSSASNDPWAQPQAAPAQPAANPVPAAPVVATSTPPAPDTNSQKLADLEKKFDDLQTADQAKDATIADLQNKLAAAQATEAQSSVSQAATTTPKTTHKHHTSSAVTVSAAPVKSSWELRAVTDGAAWVGRPGETQLTRVSVGDNVAGIGRVKAIREEGDSWIVIGTHGKIQQN